MFDPSFNTGRRGLLKSSASIAIAAPFVSTFGMMATRNAIAQESCARFELMIESPYGTVAPVADLTTGLPLLQLPPGFAYKSFGWTNDPMADGRLCPGLHDGMAVVKTRRVGRSTELTLIRNHELGTASQLNLRLVNAPTYDNSGSGNLPAGGCTLLTVRDGALVDMRPAIGGTRTNCAGGLTPWETWLTCEETTSDRTAVGGKPHGYVFEVSTDPDQTTAQPIVGMGRFSHEAACVDPTNSFVYLTEDASQVSGIYRYEPDNTGGYVNSLADGGKLMAARVKAIVQSCGASTLDQANQTAIAAPFVGDEYELEWVEIADPDQAPRTINVLGTNRNASGPFAQAWEAGCARMVRGEGIWYHAGKAYIVDTSAGGEGCVWELNLASQRMKCLYVSRVQLAGNNVDNIAVSPRGGILCCEGGGASNDGPLGNGARLFGLMPDGQPYMFAKNNLNFTTAQYAAVGKSVTGGNQVGNEFAGACFDPTGRLLFVNIQTPGITFVITGPWARGTL
ncbi:MAG: DUF839 domain-containing protein [Betaproteobacteria bacterium]|nr:DUF839 domain-containing protein [Betaproteobacteria bacterium]